MRTDAVSSFVFMVTVGCGGNVASSGDAGQSHSSTRDAGGAHSSASAQPGFDCGAPLQPTYACPDAGGATGPMCRPYGAGDAAVNASFAEGCVVTLPTCNPSYGVAQTCNCGPFPIGDAGPTWVCPL